MRSSESIRKLILWGCILFCGYNAAASNSLPLDFGMTPDVAQEALRTPLAYVSGKPGSETFVANLKAGTPSLYTVDSVVFLQFRGGRLTGWKKDFRVRPHLL